MEKEHREWENHHGFLVMWESKLLDTIKYVFHN